MATITINRALARENVLLNLNATDSLSRSRFESKGIPSNVHQLTSTPSPLLALPFEIRLQIYILALSHEPSIPRSWGHPVPCVNGNIPTSLLLVNRQIYHEACLLPFQTNEFEFMKWYGSGVFCANAFMKKLADWQVTQLRNVVCDVVERDLTRTWSWDGGWPDVCKALALGTRHLQLAVRERLSSPAEILDVDSKWISEGLGLLKGLKELELWIEDHDVDEAIIAEFDTELRELMAGCHIVLRRGLRLQSFQSGPRGLNTASDLLTI